MADEILNRNGLFLDDLTRKLRIVHPDNHQLTQDIIADCNDYQQGLSTFEEKATGVAKQLKILSDVTEREKMDTIGKRSCLLIEMSERNSVYARMIQMVLEKQAHLERLKDLHERLHHLELEYEDVLVSLAKT